MNKLHGTEGHSVEGRVSAGWRQGGQEDRTRTMAGGRSPGRWVSAGGSDTGEHEAKALHCKCAGLCRELTNQPRSPDFEIIFQP